MKLLNGKDRFVTSGVLRFALNGPFTDASPLPSDLHMDMALRPAPDWMAEHLAPWRMPGLPGLEPGPGCEAVRKAVEEVGP